MAERPSWCGFHQEAVDAQLIEPDRLWRYAERLQSAEFDYRTAVLDFDAELKRIARRHGGLQWMHLRSLLVAIVNCDVNRRDRIRRILWRFPGLERITLKPLPQADCRAIAERWLEANPIRFASDEVRTHFLRGLAQDSGGSPLAIMRMLATASAESEIDTGNVRDFGQEADLGLIDMTPLVVLLLAGAILARFIARGTGSNELYVLAGIGLAIGIVLRFFLWPMMHRRGR